jgi:AcrR family transcriptional regulator
MRPPPRSILYLVLALLGLSVLIAGRGVGGLLNYLTNYVLWSYTHLVTDLFIRARNSADRKARAERILDAAAKLLLRWGYKRVTVDDVAEHADVGKGTIYLHWKSREALFQAVLQREVVAALEELLDAVRRDPEAALLHRMTRDLFFAIIRRPLLRALYTADQEVLGRLAKGDDKALEVQEEMAFNEYLRLLVEHGLVRPDIATEELSYAYGATVNGFILLESFVTERYQLDPERKADLLAATVRRAFEIERFPSSAPVQAIVPRVIELFTEIAEVNRAKLRRAYE